MEWFLEWLRQTQEYRNFGLNPLFISATLTVVFTIVQGYGLFQQSGRVWRDRSGESLSVIFFGYAMFYFLAFMLYGAQKQSIAMTLNGALGYVHIPILAGILKFKGFTRKEWLFLGMFSLMVPAFLVLKGDLLEIMLMACLFGILVTLGKQTIETWSFVKLRRTGGADKPIALEPKFLLAFMTTNVFWFVFALYIASWPLIIFNPLAFLLIGTNYVLYYLPSRGYAREQSAV